ncbi:upf0462 protein c4orf33-like protein [Plakobranchus ocellatus]|uniref:Upf0462 protein c4orf33-like protein n=1 Tax=Plakobranchus ocellatus TaxID=259542 RepID=A0AAV4CRA4_9GAST|nr:upf0462 protein c4orf33-like protein [Plakobranchus ocellatus]
MMNLPNCKISGPKEWTDHGLRTFAIRTTWNGDCIKHEPIKITLGPASDESGVVIKVLGPFFNSPAKPDGPPGQPFPQLWDYEVVEAFFLNDKNQYLEVELSPHGQHLLLMLKGMRNVVKEELPLTTYKSIIDGDRWVGEAVIPRAYFPPSVTKFNAFAIHGEDDDRVYEALHPASKSHDVPDFHRLHYFGQIDMRSILQDYQADEVSDLWKPYIH